MAIVFRNGCLKSDGVACTKTRFVMEKVSATTHTHKHKHEHKMNISRKFNIKLIFPVLHMLSHQGNVTIQLAVLFVKKY